MKMEFSEEIDRINSLEFFFNNKDNNIGGKEISTDEIKKSFRKEIFSLNRGMNRILHNMKSLSDSIGYLPVLELKKSLNSTLIPKVYEDSVKFEKSETGRLANKYNNLVFKFMKLKHKEERLSSIEKSIKFKETIFVSEDLIKKIF